MSLNEATMINRGAELSSKTKNWPACKPILRHDIKADIPQDLWTIMRLMLAHCFYTAFLLLFNFFTALAAVSAPHDSYDDDMYFSGMVISPVWFVGWTLLTFVLYHSLYKALAHRHRGHYIFFFCGTVFEVLLSFFGMLGVSSSALMGFWQALKMKDILWVSVMCYAVSIAFVEKITFLVVALINIHKGFKNFANSYSNIANDEYTPNDNDTNKNSNNGEVNVSVV